MLAPESPVIVKQSSSHEVCPIGAKITLKVLAKGHPALTYQWFKGNQQLDGCTNPQLIVCRPIVSMIFWLRSFQLVLSATAHITSCHLLF